MMLMNTKLAVVFLLTTLAIAQSPQAKQDWQLVRSVANYSGGTIDFVLIPEAKQRDRQYYTQAADAVCGRRISCMVNFWTDPTHVPDPNRNPEVKTGWIPVSDLAVMTASYERSPKYKQPVLSLACWLYPNKKVAEADKCAYEPGARKPPDN
jgi:hypothetical protein